MQNSGRRDEQQNNGGRQLVEVVTFLTNIEEVSKKIALDTVFYGEGFQQWTAGNPGVE